MAFKISSTTVINNDRSFKTAVGLTGARPAGQTGMIRYNTSLEEFEYFNGTVWRPIASPAPAAASLYAWGFNTTGRLGDNTTTTRSSPVSVVGGFSDWVQISAGTYHTAAIRANGTAWSWGGNASGQLGDGTTTSSSSPVSVVGGFTDWVQLSAAQLHTVGIRANGTAWGWGRNNSDQLGVGGYGTSITSPLSIIGGFTDWVQVSAAATHTCALRANGTAWAWGRNAFGNLGDGTLNDKSSPVSVLGGFTNWVQISTNSQHTVALRADGTVWSWGNNSNGGLGDGTVIEKYSPVSVVGGFTDWIQVSAGYRRTVAIRANGTAWGWGFNNNGNIGDNTIINKSSPVSVVGGFTDWIQVSAGGSHTIAIRANGTAWGWGFNGSVLGDNTTTSRRSPVSVVGGFSDWVQVSASVNHSLGIRA